TTTSPLSLHDALPIYERLVDSVAGDYAAHRHRTRRDALGEGDQVWHHAIALGGEGIAEAAEAGNYFVEDQENAVTIADRAQPLRSEEHTSELQSRGQL